jgi:hypothetical protein
MDKKLTIFAMLMVSALAIFSQNKTISNSYTILNNKNPEKETFYKKSIEAADMEQYRLRNTRRHLSFDNGFVLELQSAKELFLKNQQTNINNYEVGSAQTPEAPVFFVLDSGHLTARITSKTKQ